MFTTDSRTELWVTIMTNNSVSAFPRFVLRLGVLVNNELGPCSAERPRQTSSILAAARLEFGT